MMRPTLHSPKETNHHHGQGDTDDVSVASSDRDTPTSFASGSYFRFSPTSQLLSSEKKIHYSPFVSPKAHHHHHDTGSLITWIARHLTLVIMIGLVWPWGARSWRKLEQMSQESYFMSLPPSPRSPSFVAQEAFNRLYPRDWGRHPSLWVVLEAGEAHYQDSTEHDGSGTIESHSFDDETSRVYVQGKIFSAGLSNHLLTTWCYEDEQGVEICGQDPNEPWVKVTSYYSLLQDGLDWLARTLVTPDGSKTLIEVQYMLENDVPGPQTPTRVQQLRKAIMDYGEVHLPSKLRISYTSATWDPTHSNSLLSGTSYILGALCALASIGCYLPGTYSFGIVWLVSVCNWVSTLALSSVMVFHVLMPLGLVSIATSSMSLVMAVLSLVMTIFYTSFELQLQTRGSANGKKQIWETGVALMAVMVGLARLPSVVIQSTTLGAACAVASAMIVHFWQYPAMMTIHFVRSRIVIPQHHSPQSSEPTPKHEAAAKSDHRADVVTAARIMMAMKQRISPRKTSDAASKWKRSNQHMPTLDPAMKSILFLLLSLFLCVPVSLNMPLLINTPSSVEIGLNAMASPNPDSRFGGSPESFYALGEGIGHGRLLPARILFESGGKYNISLTSLGGYDIMQLVIDELIGISLPGESELDLENSGMSVGTTHIGERYDEIQTLIRGLVSTLKTFKQQQQMKYDYHRRERRRKLYPDQDDQDLVDEYEETVKCNYNANGGIHTTTYLGISVLERQRIPQSLYSAASICGGIEPRCPSEALLLLHTIAQATTTPDHVASYLDVNLGVDPMSVEGREFFELARVTMDRLQEDPRILGGVKVYIDGLPLRRYDQLYEHNRDIKQSSSSVFWETMAVLVLVLGVSFRSATTTIRIIGSSVLCVAFTIGLGTLLYGDGLMSWTKLPALSSSSGRVNFLDNAEPDEYSWFPSLPTCLLVISLALTANIVNSCERNNHKTSSSPIAAGILPFLFSFWAFFAGSTDSFLGLTAIVVATWIERIAQTVIALTLKVTQGEQTVSFHPAETSARSVGDYQLDDLESPRDG